MKTPLLKEAKQVGWVRFMCAVIRLIKNGRNKNGSNPMSDIPIEEGREVAASLRREQMQIRIEVSTKGETRPDGLPRIVATVVYGDGLNEDLTYEQLQHLTTQIVELARYWREERESIQSGRRALVRWLPTGRY